jgi:hypothetical protein
MKRKVASCIVAIVLVFTLFPLNALALGDTGAGIQEFAGTIVLPDESNPGQPGPVVPVVPEPSLESSGLLSADMMSVNSGTCGDGLTWSFDTVSGTLTISGSGAMADWSYSSLAPWYNFSDSIYSVAISSGVTHVGSYAFYNCAHLGSAIIPEGVTSIGNSAFVCCFDLLSVSLPYSLQSIGVGVFQACSSLLCIGVADTNPFFSTLDGVLFNKGRTTLIQFPGGKSGTYSVPASVTRIGYLSFANCRLTGVTILEGVTIIENIALQACTYLISIDVAGGNPVFSSLDGVLFNKDKTTLIQVPGGKSGAYTVPESVTRIGDNAFVCCLNLTGVIIPPSVTSLGFGVFQSCVKLTELAIPSGVTSIGPYTFSYCSVLKTITIPVSVTSIGDNAFNSCPALTDVYYGGSAAQWSAVSIGANNGSLAGAAMHYGGSGTTPLSGACGTGLTWSLDTGTGVLTISGAGAMTDWSYASKAPWYGYSASINSIVLSVGVTHIGAYAFYYCSHLTDAVIPEGVTSIGDSAFSCCLALTSITLPSSLQSIGSGILQACSSMTSISVAGSNPRLSSQDGVLFNKSKTWLLQFPGGVTGTYTIPTAVTYISGSAFSDCLLTGVTIHSGVITIGSGAFLACPNLTGIDVADGNPAYSSQDGVLFNKNMTDLLQYPGGKVGDYTIPPVVTSIETMAFFCCFKLANVVIPPSVTSINPYTFAYCDNLKTVTIPVSVTSIGDGAFAGCTGLTDIYYGGSAAQWSVMSILGNNGSLTGATIHYGGSGTTPLSGTCGDGVTWSFDTGTHVLTIGGTGSMTDWSYSSNAPWYSYGASINGISIGGGVTHIGAYAFRNCTNLSSIAIPEGVTSIGNDAFFCCFTLSGVTLPSSLQIIGSGVFQACGNLLAISVSDANPCFSSQDGILFDKSKTALIQFPAGRSGTYTIPNGVTNIGDIAFESCRLSGVMIQEGVTSIGRGAFEGSASLISIGVAAGNPSYTSQDGVLFNKQMTTLIQYPGGRSGVYTIPSGVTVIGDMAFFYCPVLTAVTIPSGVTCINPLTFAFCNSLSTVSLPASVASIGDSAFSNCNALTDIYYGGTQAQWSAVSIGTNNGSLTGATVHYGGSGTPTSGTCGENLTWSLDLSTGTLTIGGTGPMTDWYNPLDVPWYNYRAQIKSVVVDGGVTGIGGYAFYSCSNLLNVTVPSAVTVMGYYAFAQCTSLTSFEIPSGMTYININTFNGCTSLVTVSIPAGIRDILYGAFFNCFSLTDVYYGGTVVQWNMINMNSGNDCLSDAVIHFSGSSNETLTWSLDKETGLLTIDGTGPMTDWTYGSAPWYDDAASITGVVIGSGITSIGSLAFYNCPHLSGVTIPSSVTSIGDGAFASCGSLPSIDIPSTVTSIGSSAFDSCTKLKIAVIHSGVATIGAFAFNNCISLESITIPASVTTLGDSAFQSCTSLKSIDIPSGVNSVGVCVFSFCSSLEDVTIEPGVTGIGAYMFQDCSSLGGLTIPGSVTGIGVGAFQYCTSLKSVDIQTGVSDIENSAFQGCDLLTDVTIADGLTSIGGGAFTHCRSLAVVSIPKSVTAITDGAFSSCSSLTAINVADANPNYSSRDGVLFNKDQTYLLQCPGKRSGAYVIPSGVTDIRFGAFEDCENLTSVSMPSGVKTIGSVAFSGCTGLQGIIIPPSVTRIESYAFSGCTALSAVTLPAGLSFIGEYAFSNCTSLAGITIPSSVSSIAAHLFEYCTNLASVILLPGVSSIGNEAFYYCTSLTSITAPLSLTSISSAFQYCYNLADVYYAGSQTQWNAIAIGVGNQNLINATIHYNSILYQIAGVTITAGTTANVVLCNDAACTVVVAAYNPVGRLLGVGVVSAAKDAGSVAVPLNMTALPASYTLKVFLLGAGSTPLCPEYASGV